MSVVRTPNPYFPRTGKRNEAAARRDRLLLESDWTQGPDSGLTPLQAAAWAEYRRRLEAADLMADVRTWPAAPSEARMRALKAAEGRAASLDIRIDWRGL